MPAKRSKHGGRRRLFHGRRRGAGIKDWVKRAHGFIRSKNGYSRGLSHAYNKWGKPLVNSKLSKSNSALVQMGVKAGLAKLKQSGYGLRRSGNGLRRAGNGLRRAGNGQRMKY